MIYAIDIDGVIAITSGNDYPNSKPNCVTISRINSLYAQGHTIKIFTGRGSSSGIDWRELTIQQLSDWGVRYHELILGKPPADVFVDDKAMTPDQFLLPSPPSDLFP